MTWHQDRQKRTYCSDSGYYSHRTYNYSEEARRPVRGRNSELQS